MLHSPGILQLGVQNYFITNMFHTVTDADNRNLIPEHSALVVKGPFWPVLWKYHGASVRKDHGASFTGPQAQCYGRTTGLVLQDHRASVTEGPQG